MKSAFRGRMLYGWTVFLFLAAVGPLAAAEENAIEFGRDIRPLLSDKCFACHGPDDANREGGFRFDDPKSAMGEADSGDHPIVPGKPEASGMFTRITSPDESMRMPPVETQKSLTEQEIDLLRQWIAQGAKWDDHWSLKTPVRPPLPPVKDAAWPRSPIDHFVLARLEAKGLKPSPEADRETLIRRVTFDLTGVPPTPAEVDAFLADQSPEAYDRLVDRLLRSPRYGEHMARFWLDAARYGDTHGMHLDNYREMWPYRDWVVRAFNENMHYDEFVRLQLAGDLLPNPTVDQIVATGFNRAHISTNEGGAIAAEVEVRNVVDRVTTAGTVFMGLTFECTRCHDHKFDPLTQADFYSMYAFFNSVEGDAMDGNRKDHAPTIRVPSEQQAAKLAEFDGQIAPIEAKLRSPWAELDAMQTAWEKEQLDLIAKETMGEAPLALSPWQFVGPFNEDARYFRKKQGPEGKPVKLDEKFTLSDSQVVAWTARPEWTDGAVHNALPGGIAVNFLYRTIVSDRDRTVRVSLGSNDGLRVYLNGRSVHDDLKARRNAAADQVKLKLKLKKGENHFLMKVSNQEGECGFYFKLLDQTADFPPGVVDAMKIPAADRNDQQRMAVQDHFRNNVAEFKPFDDARAQLAKLRADRAAVDRDVPTTLIWRELPQPKPAFILKRGEYDQHGEQVGRRTPLALPPMKEGLPANRLGLAEWLLDPTHPLTSRVAVNRYWQQAFGTAIVKTAEDFGSQGEMPSHPRLLDWLAVEFREGGWDVKEFMKQLVTSASYRQSSQVDKNLLQLDPANRLLARGPRFRLDAEMLRDQALFVSGLLSDEMGGPGVKPPQPGGLWYAVAYTSSNTAHFKADQGHDKVHRRTLYTFIKRTAPPPQMSLVDGPSRESCIVRRERTNTPLQALMLMNDPQYIEAARALAQRSIAEGGVSPRQRAAYMFRLCTGRSATDAELAELVVGYAQDLQHYTADVEAAKSLLGIGEYPIDKSIDPSDLAAWTMIGNLLLNLDEVVTKN